MCFKGLSEGEDRPECPHFHGVKLKWLKIGSHKDSCTTAHIHTHANTNTHIFRVKFTQFSSLDQRHSCCQVNEKLLASFTVKSRERICITFYNKHQLMYIYRKCLKTSNHPHHDIPRRTKQVNKSTSKAIWRTFSGHKLYPWCGTF